MMSCLYQIMNHDFLINYITFMTGKLLKRSIDIRVFPGKVNLGLFLVSQD